MRNEPRGLERRRLGERERRRHGTRNERVARELSEGVGLVGVHDAPRARRRERDVGHRLSLDRQGPLDHREQLALGIARDRRGARVHRVHRVRGTIYVEVQSIAEEVLMVRRIDAGRHEVAK